MNVAKRTVSYANRFIEAVYKIDCVEKKLLSSIIHKVQSEGDREKYDFSVKELADIVGIKKPYRDIKDAIRTLASQQVWWDNSINSAEEGEFEFLHFIDSGKCKDGVISLRLSPEMKRCVFNLTKEFTRYKLFNIRPLRSTYSIRIYELLKQYQDIGFRSFELDELRTILGCEGKYAMIGHFKQRVIDKAQEELKENCDIYFDYEFKKLGRTYKSIAFRIYTKEFFSIEEEQPDLPGIPPSDPEREEVELQMHQYGYRRDFSELLKKYGLEKVCWYWKSVLQPELDKIGGNDHGGLITKRFKSNCETAFKAKLVKDQQKEAEESLHQENLNAYLDQFDQTQFVMHFVRFIDSLDPENRKVVEEHFKPTQKLTDWGQRVQKDFLEWFSNSTSAT